MSTKKNKLKGLVEAEDIHGTTNNTILSRLFRRMLVYVAGTVDVGPDNIDTLPVDSGNFTNKMLSFGKYDSLMNMFVLDKRNCIASNRKDQSSARGNLQKEIFKADMSWKVFTKGLRFLGVRSFELTITLHHHNGRSSIHSESVNIGQPTTVAKFDGTVDFSQIFPGSGREFVRDLEQDARTVKQAANIVSGSDKNI